MRNQTPRHLPTRGRLYLDHCFVGDVAVRRRVDAWGMGDFEPAPGFAPFAPLYGAWSLLMHVDGDARLSPEAADELREAERAMDSIHAEILLDEPHQWRRIRQLNIDGPMIEWQEDEVDRHAARDDDDGRAAAPVRDVGEIEYAGARGGR